MYLLSKQLYERSQIIKTTPEVMKNIKKYEIEFLYEIRQILVPSLCKEAKNFKLN